MKLIAFSVHNYRSITSTPRLELADLTVLVGPNNEGKSNLLSALLCALALAQDVRVGIRRMAFSSRTPYSFQRDFPVALQADSSAPSSRFTLEFELDEPDKAAFKLAVGSRLNGTLRIQLLAPRDGNIGFKVIKQGPAQKALSAKRAQIAAFISARLQFQYIGAIRSEAQSRDIVEEMTTRALTALEANDDYQKALTLIEVAERPLLDSVSQVLASTLRPFLPRLRGVSARVSREQRTRALHRSTEIWLDDGTLTPLSQKGDGVKSLVAVALAKAAAESSAEGKKLILAIEEPEAHLHSGAIHSLKSLLEDIASEHQVIISTHEPALVRRDAVQSNVLVENNKARSAQSLEEVRRVLGVQLGENLTSPDVVVLVEGTNDASLLEKYAAVSKPSLRHALQGGRLSFRPLNGAGNLGHQLRFYQSLVCTVLAFLDDDLEGNRAFDRAKLDGLMDGSAVFVVRRPGAQESELEDLIDPKLYSDILLAQLGIARLRPKSPRARKAKWSTRLEAVLKESGKPLGEIPSLISGAKHQVNVTALASIEGCFLPAVGESVEQLMQVIDRTLSSQVLRRRVRR